MKKKLLSILAIFSLLAGVLTGCGEKEPLPTYDNSLTQESPNPVEVLNKNPSLSQADPDADFNTAFISFMEEAGFKDKNYMVSPTSFRAALALAISGADGETKDELLKAMGFESTDAMLSWYSSVSRAVTAFSESLEQDKAIFEENKEYMEEGAASPDGAFSLENSIWRNTKASGKLSKDYIQYVNEHFGAAAENVSADKITDAVNSWINENTNGMIPRISNDLSYADLILANTIYLRTSWRNDFWENATQPGDFTTKAGTTVEKEFMHQQDKFRYYEDENGKFVVLPMAGGINAVFILGDVEDVMEKMKTASYEEVDVSLPKFETESSFDQNELIAFCMSRGATSAFGDKADFSLMSDEMSLCISDIIQKTKIKVDEDGIEAAAATVIMMTETAMIEEPIVMEFHADKPFRYMLLTDSEAPELLFYGQIVE